MVYEGLGAERLVFVDEMGTNTSLAPLYTWSRKGRAGAAEGVAQLGCERHLVGEHNGQRDGTVPGG